MPILFCFCFLTVECLSNFFFFLLWLPCSLWFILFCSWMVYSLLLLPTEFEVWVRLVYETVVTGLGYIYDTCFSFYKELQFYFVIYIIDGWAKMGGFGRGMFGECSYNSGHGVIAIYMTFPLCASHGIEWADPWCWKIINFQEFVHQPPLADEYLKLIINRGRGNATSVMLPTSCPDDVLRYLADE